MAVAGLVDRVFQVARRHELGVAHGACPGAAQLAALDIALLDQLQRSQELVTEEVAAIADVRQRRERADHVLVALERAVIGLHPPDAEDDLLGHAIAGFGLGQHAGMSLQHLAAARDAAAADSAVEIAPDRRGEFRLLAGKRDDGRIGRHALESQVEGLARDAARLRHRPERLQEAVEARCGRPCLGLGNLRPRRIDRTRRLREGRPEAERHGEGENGDGAHGCSSGSVAVSFHHSARSRLTMG